MCVMRVLISSVCFYFFVRFFVYLILRQNIKNRIFISETITDYLNIMEKQILKIK